MLTLYIHAGRSKVCSYFKYWYRPGHCTLCGCEVTTIHISGNIGKFWDLWRHEYCYTFEERPVNQKPKVGNIFILQFLSHIFQKFRPRSLCHILQIRKKGSLQSTICTLLFCSRPLFMMVLDTGLRFYKGEICSKVNRELKLKWEYGVLPLKWHPSSIIGSLQPNKGLQTSASSDLSYHHDMFGKFLILEVISSLHISF